MRLRTHDGWLTWSNADSWLKHGVSSVQVVLNSVSFRLWLKKGRMVEGLEWGRDVNKK